jgi:hypothetical protein
MTTGSPSTKPAPQHPRVDGAVLVSANTECLPTHSWTYAALTLMDTNLGSVAVGRPAVSRSPYGETLPVPVHGRPD